jgi:hypothetical protein
MESENDQQSSALFDGNLDKVQVHRILEGMFMQQVMELLGPCFRQQKRSSCFECCSLQLDNKSSPSESIPEIVAREPQVESPSDLDCVKSEILKRTG